MSFNAHYGDTRIVPSHSKTPSGHGGGQCMLRRNASTLIVCMRSPYIPIVRCLQLATPRSASFTTSIINPMGGRMPAPMLCPKRYYTPDVMLVYESFY